MTTLRRLRLLRRPGSALVVTLVALAGCGGDDGTPEATSSTTASSTSSSSSTSTPPATEPDAAGTDDETSSTTAGKTPGTTARTGGGGSARSFDPEGVVRLAPVGTDTAASPSGDLTGRLRGGVLLPFDIRRSGWLHVLTPCEREVWVREVDAEPIEPVEVVLDPGHGGSDEPGAVGPTGLTEAEINLDVANRAVKALQGVGVRALLTRESDYRATLAFRVALTAAAGAPVLVAVHHNADPDGPSDGPGTETYYQHASEGSKRLAGLLYQEVVGALSPFTAEWVADDDAGVKARLSSSGEDFYGILRNSAARNIPAVLAELAFLSNPSEEALLRRPDVRRAEGDALARGIQRYLRTDEQGSGFVVPHGRNGPGGPGGGRQGCVDPV